MVLHDLPAWSLVSPEDPRYREGPVEAPAYVSAEWARRIRAVSNRPWTNAARVIAALADECPAARYVEGWAAQTTPVWHAWVDVPLGTTEQAWLRIDATPSWRWTLEHNRYAPVLEVRAAVLARFVAPMRQPRGRALCRLPLTELAPEPKLATPRPAPAESFGAQFGEEAALRASVLRADLLTWREQQALMGQTDARAELDRFAALRVLPE